MKSFFIEPNNAVQRQYEALRAPFVDGLSQAEAAKKFDYTPGSYRVMLFKFRANPAPTFFIQSRRSKTHTKATDPLRERTIAFRKQNLSVYDIADQLKADHGLSVPALSKILREEGFAKQPRRRDDERPQKCRVQPADVADCRNSDVASCYRGLTSIVVCK